MDPKEIQWGRVSDSFDPVWI